MIIKSLLIVAFVAYFLYGCLIFFSQEKIIFYPVEYNRDEIQNIEKQLKSFEFKFYNKEEKFQITYWESSPKSKNFKIIFYFGGNAENTNYTALEISQHPEILNFKWILINYPGYNGSSGSVGEKNMYLYASEIYDFIIKQYNTQIEEVILIGRSIGSGVASYLHKVKKCDKLILITPFDSLETIAKIYFPLYPAKLLLKHKFRVVEYLKNSQIPILVLLAEKDEIIPEASTKNLLKQLETMQNKEIFIIPYTSHNTISDSPLYWKYLLQFLKN